MSSPPPKPAHRENLVTTEHTEVNNGVNVAAILGRAKKRFYHRD